MNYGPNTINWKVGDIVIHDADAKIAGMLMKVVETGCDFGMVRTEYVEDCTAHKYSVLPREELPYYLNDIKYLHDPLLFGIDISDTNDIYKRAISTWGTDVQRLIFVEEAAETIVAISHFRRGKCTLDEVVGEFADLQIMLNQMIEMYGRGIFDKIFAQKLAALKTKLDKVGGQ